MHSDHDIDDLFPIVTAAIEDGFDLSDGQASVMELVYGPGEPSTTLGDAGDDQMGRVRG